MSMNLAELGLVLCQEFDQRELELDTLHSEIRTKVKSDREELIQQRDGDRTNLRKARTQIRKDVIDLLDKYRVERKSMEQVQKDNRVSQINEIKTWINERGEELKVWYKSGGYLVRKRTGR